MSAGGGPPRGVQLLLALSVALAALVALDRPVNVDETNFLRLAAGAVAEPWRPHNVLINWQGTTERAFDVLSNPPGIAWWLAPVAETSVWVKRLWMLPWGLLAGWGCLSLAARFGASSALGLVISPVVVMAATTLTPDIPLFACVVAGMAGFIAATDRGESGWAWALLVGLGSVFRYSGLAILPLLPLYALLQRKSLWPAAFSAIPLLAMQAHDLHAYGELHLLAMGKFQSVSNSGFDLLHKAVAVLAALGGVCALPVFQWRKQVLVGAGIGALAGWNFGALGAAFGAIGGASLASSWEPNRRPAPDTAFLFAWALGGFLFLLTLRFSAARYWLPFFVPVVLVASGRWTTLRLCLTAALTVILVTEDAVHARAEAALARQVTTLGRGVFTGHWGWQSALESAGWTPLNEGDGVPRGTLVAVPEQAWPQAVNISCNQVIFEGEARGWVDWLPRGYTAAGKASLHSNWLAGHPPVRIVAPWGFGNDAYERARVCQE